MAHPFLTQDFHIRWSTLTPDHIQNDIREALARAQTKLDAVIEQDRGKMNFERGRLIEFSGSFRPALYCC